MTAATLPTNPAPWNATPRFIGFGIDATPALGGVTQRIARLGSRWSVTLDFPAVTGQYAGAFRAALIKARSSGSTIRVRWPQAGLRDFGKPLVNGATQTGFALACDAFTGGTIPAGTFFSFEVSSRSYLYQISDDISIVSGSASLPISPMIRVSPADNTALQFSPIIEGWLSGNDQEWTFERIAWEGFQITVTEAE